VTLPHQAGPARPRSAPWLRTSPTGPHTATVHWFLAELRAAGFDGAPEPRGMTGDGRERLGFIPGDVAVPPYPAWAQAAEALASIARLMRRLHDAAARAGVPGGRWNPELADPAGGPIVCHSDVCLENVVFRDGDAIGLIDFDFAAPGLRRAARPVGRVAMLRAPTPLVAEPARGARARPPVRAPATLPQLHGEVADMNLGAPELLILSLGVVPFALLVWGIVDASSRPAWAWQQSGQNQTLWIVLMVVGLFMCVVGAALALVYLLAIRPQVASQQIGGPHPGPPPPPPSVPLA
jgi:hypothetical protein